MDYYYKAIVVALSGRVTRLNAKPDQTDETWLDSKLIESFCGPEYTDFITTSGRWCVLASCACHSPRSDNYLAKALLLALREMEYSSLEEMKWIGPVLIIGVEPAPFGLQACARSLDTDELEDIEAAIMQVIRLFSLKH
jgi:hypothetical protein